MNSIRFRAPPTHAPLPPHPRSFARVSHSPRASHTRLFVRVPRDKPVSSSPLLLSFSESLRENSPLRSRKRVGESVNRSKGSRPLLLARFSPSSAREENNRGVNVGVSSSFYVNRSNSRQAIKCKAVSRWIGGGGFPPRRANRRRIPPIFLSRPLRVFTPCAPGTNWQDNVGWGGPTDRVQPLFSRDLKKLIARQRPPCPLRACSSFVANFLLKIIFRAGE